MSAALQVIFWLSIALLAYAQLGYPLLVAASARWRKRATRQPLDDAALPTVTLIIAAYAEAGVIAAKVANALELDYPRDKLQVIVACDGSPDDTAELARAAGADLVLELPRGGKMQAQNVGVDSATGDLLAFSDANAFWQPDALRRLVDCLVDPQVAYVCGRVNFVNAGGTNQEGLYWRYELWLRERESQLHSVTAGNGAIYAVRAAAYKAIAPQRGHDLSLPFQVVKHGGRASYEPLARASEKMAPSLQTELGRKRRMMTFAWPIILGEGMLSPRGYGLLYGWMMFSHRGLRYSTPLIHLIALVVSAILAFESTLYLVIFLAQVALVALALLGKFIALRPLLIVRYYVLTTASIALGLWDHLRGGTPTGWTPPEGTR